MRDRSGWFRVLSQFAAIWAGVRGLEEALGGAISFGPFLGGSGVTRASSLRVPSLSGVLGGACVPFSARGGWCGLRGLARVGKIMRGVMSKKHVVQTQEKRLASGPGI